MTASGSVEIVLLARTAAAVGARPRATAAHAGRVALTTVAGQQRQRHRTCVHRILARYDGRKPSLTAMHRRRFGRLVSMVMRTAAAAAAAAVFVAAAAAMSPVVMMAVVMTMRLLLLMMLATTWLLMRIPTVRTDRAVLAVAG